MGVCSHFFVVLYLIHTILPRVTETDDGFMWIPVSDPEANFGAYFAVNMHNSKSNYSNLFRVKKLTSAKFKTVKLGMKKYIIKFQIQETLCRSKDKINLLECEYRQQNDAISGSCVAELCFKLGFHVEELQNLICQLSDPKSTSAVAISKPQKRTCEGCPISVSPEDLKVKEIMEQILQDPSINPNNNFKLCKVTHAAKEVAVGEKYWISFWIERIYLEEREIRECQGLFPSLGTTDLMQSEYICNALFQEEEVEYSLAIILKEVSRFNKGHKASTTTLEPTTASIEPTAASTEPTTVDTTAETPTVAETTETTAVAETTPTTAVAETTPTTAVAETTPTTAVAETIPTTTVAETTPTTTVAETTPTTAV
nr:PREDICTED: kininogen-2-like [Latimeria chalumnae]|eukprot:XP_014343497.1 PREDICTED: kininogen-2-like [Latimeria chalumnae]